MIRKVIYTFCISVGSLLLCSTFGCMTTMGHRFYSGPALANNEVALIYAVSGCRIQTIRGEGEREEKALGDRPQYMLELVPGWYSAVIQYGRVDGGTYSATAITTGGRVQRKLTVQAGNVYIIYPEIKGPNMPYYLQDTPEKRKTWRPIILNISEYSKEECEKSSGGRCPEKEKIRESAMKYPQGERRTMSYHPVETPFTYDVEGENRVYKGFWW